MKASQLPVPDSIAQAYGRDGFWIEHQLFSESECRELKAEAVRVLKEKARPNATVYVGVAAASSMYHRLASDPRLVSILQTIMPDGVAFMSDKNFPARHVIVPKPEQPVPRIKTVGPR